MQNTDVPDPRATVLVVEDDPDTQTYMRELLRRHYNVVTAGTAAAARDFLADSAREISVILMDLSLKGDENGIDLTRSLRRSGVNVPIVAVTAHAHTEDRVRSLEAGCDLYLPKPASPQALLAAIKDLIARARSSRRT